MRKNDYLLILLIILLAAGSHLFMKANATNTDLTFEIRQGDHVVQTIKRSALTTAGEFTISTSDGNVFIEIDPAKGAHIIDSSCPDKLCIHQGYINKNGQTILCLPEKVLVTAVADRKDGEPDAVLR